MIQMPENNPVSNLPFSLFCPQPCDVLFLFLCAPSASHWCSAFSSDFFSFRSRFVALDAALCSVLSLRSDSVTACGLVHLLPR